MRKERLLRLLRKPKLRFTLGALTGVAASLSFYHLYRLSPFLAVPTATTLLGWSTMYFWPKLSRAWLYRQWLRWP